MSSLASRDSENKISSYNRKEKSLGVLCSKFFKLYNRDGVDLIGLDNAATLLGVERRRIYDIVNILESVGVLARKGKNMYSWKGFSAIPRALDEIKEEAIRDYFCTSNCFNSANVLNGNEYGRPSNSNTVRQDKSSVSSEACNRKEKSLALLTQNFIKLFLCSDVDLISLDNAATALLGDIHDPTAMRTKVRRIYDIANVFSSMHLIEKVRHPKNGKPAFRWLGVKGKPKNAVDTALDLNESKKRVFGSEITNTGSKRCKADSLIDWKSNEKENLPMHIKHDNLNDEYVKSLMKQHPEHTSKDFVFGPFTPASVTKEGASGNKDARRVHDWESLASTYRPQYCNQALSGLFAHYVEAWKSWHVEAAEKEHIQSVS